MKVKSLQKFIREQADKMKINSTVVSFNREGILVENSINNNMQKSQALFNQVRNFLVQNGFKIDENKIDKTRNTIYSKYFIEEATFSKDEDGDDAIFPDDSFEDDIYDEIEDDENIENEDTIGMSDEEYIDFVSGDGISTSNIIPDDEDNIELILADDIDELEIDITDEGEMKIIDVNAHNGEGSISESRKRRLNESSADLMRIKNWLEEMGIKNYNINPDLTVDVDGDVNLSRKGLDEIPIQFGVVTGWFYCRNNQLTSLQGAPREVGGGFYCGYTQLTSLQGAPREVGDNFICDNNHLTSLQGAPREVGGSFVCSHNELTTLEGAPREVGGSFVCSYNQLTSLQGAPEIVGDDFYCDSNQLTSLEGAPKEVGDDFYCKDNPIAFKMTPNDVRKYLRQNGTILGKGAKIITNLTNKGKNISTIQKERELRGAKTRLSNRQSRYDSLKREIEDINADLYGDQERYSYETYGESRNHINERVRMYGDDDMEDARDYARDEELERSMRDIIEYALEDYDFDIPIDSVEIEDLIEDEMGLNLADHIDVYKSILSELEDNGLIELDHMNHTIIKIGY